MTKRAFDKIAEGLSEATARLAAAAEELSVTKAMDAYHAKRAELESTAREAEALERAAKVADDLVQHDTQQRRFAAAIRSLISRSQP